MRRRYAVISTLGVALIAIFGILGPPAAASVNPCGLGYTLKLSAPPDRIRSPHLKRVQPIGTIKGYSLGDAKCAILSINPSWKRLPEIRLLGLWLGGVSITGDWENRTLTATPKDWTRRTPLSGPSIGPIKITMEPGYNAYMDGWAYHRGEADRYTTDLSIQLSF